MNFRRRRLALAAFLAFALTPAAAMAQSTKSGWYASVSGAYAIPIDSTVSVKVEGHTGTSKLESKNGFAIMAGGRVRRIREPERRTRIRLPQFQIHQVQGAHRQRADN